ncbi:MAG: hypothetical protein KAS64_00575 [Spirochaetes bacterium]|nr:hypothetical protein [Spirochaetota bacterium]
MQNSITGKDRVWMIRKGNEYYNSGQIEKAKKLFLATNYKDGIIRVADYYYFEVNKPVLGLILYRHAGCKNRVEEIYERIVMVIRLLMKKDDTAFNNNKNSIDNV